MEYVFDIGMHNGDDTAYYLHKGYRVVAVEANPTLVDLVRERFHAEIQQNRLQILNVGITEDRGEKNFYISVKNSVWSSFDKDNATKGGGEFRSLKVPCIKFRDLLDQFGTPYYVKIDIEGNDSLCLEDLDASCAPNFVSFEMSHADAHKDIDRLSGLGYLGFKCIRQNDFLHMTPQNVDRECGIRRAVHGLDFLRKAINKTRYLTRPRDGSWKFPRGSSGMFGNDLRGKWLSRDEVKVVWRKLHDIHDRLSCGGLGEWFDIHARLSDGTK
jgi:FkbM family methyltransferase